MKNLIKRHEGTKYRPYKCSQGLLTIGVGHNLDAAPLPRHMAAQLAKSGFITPDMVEELFEMDLQSALRSCRRVWPGFDGFSAARQNALADFMFNLGEGGVKKFINTNKAINESRWDDAAKGMQNSKWYKQVGNRSPEIVEMVKNG